MKSSLIEKISKSTLNFLEPLDLTDTYVVIVKEALKLINFNTGSIYLDINGELQKVYSSSPFLYQIKIRKGGFTYKTFRTRKITILDRDTSLKIHPDLKETNIKTSIFIPLINQKKSIGVLSLDSVKEKKFKNEEIEGIKLLGLLASMAIRKSQLFSETKNALNIRDRFISMASHELRTPLTTVNGYIQLLYSKLAGSDSVESKWIEQLHAESIRLTNLVKEVLELNLVKSGKLIFDWKECKLSEIIGRSLSNFKFNHPKREIIFENHIQNSQDFVIGDYDKLIQAINNLLDNAVKFSPPEKNIKLELTSNSHNIIIRVIDQGEGILKKDLSKVDQEFYKGSNNLKEGMGIGLFLVKHILNQHQGLLSIQSERKKGTIVEMQLPKVKSYGNI